VSANAEDRDLDRLAESVASAHDVDWDDAVAQASGGGERSHIEALRDVARVAGFHRALQREAAGAGGPRALERWGDLLLLERVGAGTSADVYRAWDPALEREVAVKLLRPGARGEAWLEEARALARVRDLHVVAVHGAAEHGGRAGLWMEYLHGPTLEAEIARRGALPVREVACLGAQLAGALAAVHDAGALHRDVKPANVVLERDGRAVLTDFGLGRRATGDPDSAAFSGTPLFMSPQRLAGASARVGDDVYALGVTLWCALAGREPFAATSVQDLRRELASGPAPSLRDARRDAPEVLAAAIESAMARDPADRFADARAMGRALEDAARASDGPAVAALAAQTRGHHEARESAGRREAKHFQLGWGIALGVAAFAAVIAFQAWRSERARGVGEAPRAEAPTASDPAAPSGTPSGATIGPTAAAYDVAATFLARRPAGVVRLQSGDRVKPGDALSLEFRATRPAYVYVLDADESGETYLLFPQPMFDRVNPLPADSTFVLPGTRSGKESAWTVTSRGGREHLLVVASPEPLADLERELAALPSPAPNRPVSYARLGDATVDRLRGIGGVSEVPGARTPPAPRGPSGAFEKIRTLAETERGVQGPWVRQVVLSNPR
jgi:hypothetical protein